MDKNLKKTDNFVNAYNFGVGKTKKCKKQKCRSIYRTDFRAYKITSRIAYIAPLLHFGEQIIHNRTV